MKKSFFRPITQSANTRSPTVNRLPGRRAFNVIANCLAVALVTAASLGPLLSTGRAAELQTSGTASDRLQRDTTSSLDAVRLGLISRTTALIGMKAKDRHERSLGKVEDLVVDLSTGRVLVALISSGSDNQVTPVPARSFWTATKNKILVNADRKKFESAPQISKADASRTLQVTSFVGSFRHFSQVLPETPPAGSGGLSSTAGLVGLRLLSQTDEPLGQVEDVMVDLPVGRVVYLVIQPVGDAGSQDALYPVPPQAIRPDATSRALALKADQAHFLAGPRFQKAYCTDMNRPELSAAMLQHYSLQASPGQPDPTREPVRARLETAGTPSQVTPARSDQEITQAVVTEIVRNNSAFPTRDLKITTSNGRVTLAGRVKNEKQKQQLAAAATRVVGAENVINQL